MSRSGIGFVAGGLLCLWIGLVCAGTLVTVETEKARLTIELLKRFVQLENRLREKKVLSVLILAPKTKTAFQDQYLVNETVIETFRHASSLFHIQIVHSGKEAEKALRQEDFDILYIAGLVPKLSRILRLCEQKGVLSVSHLTELVPLGVTLSLDLERRRACIVANKESWQRLGLRLPSVVEKRIAFMAGAHE